MTKREETTEKLIHELSHAFTKELHGGMTIMYHVCKDVLTWLFRFPLSERLTAEEKERVRTMYKEAVEGNIEMEGMRPLNTFSQNAVVQRMGVNIGCMSTLKAIFGPDFFKEDE